MLVRGEHVRSLGYVFYDLFKSFVSAARKTVSRRGKRRALFRARRGSAAYSVKRKVQSERLRKRRQLTPTARRTEKRSFMTEKRSVIRILSSFIRIIILRRFN